MVGLLLGGVDKTIVWGGFDYWECTLDFDLFMILQKGVELGT